MLGEQRKSILSEPSNKIKVANELKRSTNNFKTLFGRQQQSLKRGNPFSTKIAHTIILVWIESFNFK